MNSAVRPKDYSSWPREQQDAWYDANVAASVQERIADDGPAVKELPILAGDSLAGLEIPLRRWIVQDLIPDRTVTMLSGDGGIGKSLLALQLAIAVSMQREWIGTLPEYGPAIYVSAEDDRDELHRRVAGIAAKQGIDLTDLRDLHMIPLAGSDAVMGVPEGKANLIRETDVWRGLVQHVERLRPRLIVLDTLADVFAGNEIARQEARQFVGQLRGLALRFELAVVLLAHPSLDGLRSGSGTSGSTAWSNSVRSRLYLEKLKMEDDSDLDPDLRVLRVKKANYGPSGNDITLRWANGCFGLEGSGNSFEKLAADAKADDVFLALLRQFRTEGRDVCARQCSTYAPNVFASHPDSKGVRKRDFLDAMNRLLKEGKISVETFGPPSRQRTRLAINEN
jgi:RecA-family ATPase